MSAFNVAEAQIVALFTESVLYGSFFATFGECLRALLWHGKTFRGSADVKWALLVVACAMAVNGTVDIALNFQHNLEAFILYSGQGGAVGEFSILRNWINVARGVTWAIQAIIGDGILVYRVHIVWAGSVAACAIPYCEARVSGEALLTVTQLNNWTNATVILTLVLNIVGTGLIAFRVWRVAHVPSLLSSNHQQKPVQPTAHSPLAQVLRIIVESGLLYTVSAVVLFITSVVKSNAIYAVSDSLTQIIGICFNLIIVRVNWHSSALAAGAGAGSSSGPAGHTSFMHGHASQLDSRAAHGGSFPLHFVSHSGGGHGHRKSVGTLVPLHVTVRKDVEFDAGSVSGGESGVSPSKEAEAEEGNVIWAR